MQDSMLKVYKYLAKHHHGEKCERILCQDSKKIALVVNNYNMLQEAVRNTYPFDAHDCNIYIENNKLTMDDAFMKNII